VSIGLPSEERRSKAALSGFGPIIVYTWGNFNRQKWGILDRHYWGILNRRFWGIFNRR
jgi:hypothetical protein